MKKSVLWIISTFFLVLVAGIVLYSVARPFELETHEYEIKENLKDIILTVDTADVQFVLSENQNNLVVCKEEKNAIHSVVVNENTLRIETVNNKKWYENICINLSKPKITVFLGKEECNNISIKTDTGDISLNSIIAAGKFEIETDTGNVKIETCNASEVFIKNNTGNVSLDNLIAMEKLKIENNTGNVKIETCNASEVFIENDTGNVSLDNLIATEKLKIEADTGNVKFKACDASEVFIETDTGNVTGSFLTDKVVFAESKTGNVDIPKVIADEKCEIITDTGDIKITIKK